MLWPRCKNPCQGEHGALANYPPPSPSPLLFPFTSLLPLPLSLPLLPLLHLPLLSLPPRSSVPGIEPRALCLLGRFSTIVLYQQLSFYFLILSQGLELSDLLHQPLEWLRFCNPALSGSALI